jgi:hypothetical protein
LNLIERWTRTGPITLEYVVTIEDPTAFTRPWTVRQEFGNSEQENKIYYEPRCIEGNYSFPALLRGARWRSSPSWKGEVLTRQPGTTPQEGDSSPTPYNDITAAARSANASISL